MIKSMQTKVFSTITIALKKVIWKRMPDNSVSTVSSSDDLISINVVASNTLYKRKSHTKETIIVGHKKQKLANEIHMNIFIG